MDPQAELPEGKMIGEGPTTTQTRFAADLLRKGYRVKGPTIHIVSDRAVVVQLRFGGPRARALEDEGCKVTPSADHCIVEPKAGAYA